MNLIKIYQSSLLKGFARKGGLGRLELSDEMLSGINDLVTSSSKEAMTELMRSGVRIPNPRELHRKIIEISFKKMKESVLMGIQYDVERLDRFIKLKQSEGFSSDTQKQEWVDSIGKNRSEFVMRNAVLKNQGDATRVSSIISGITHFKWITSRDGRVSGNPSGIYPKDFMFY